MTTEQPSAGQAPTEPPAAGRTRPEPPTTDRTPTEPPTANQPSPEPPSTDQAPTQPPTAGPSTEAKAPGSTSEAQPSAALPVGLPRAAVPPPTATDPTLTPTPTPTSVEASAATPVAPATIPAGVATPVKRNRFWRRNRTASAPSSGLLAAPTSGPPAAPTSGPPAAPAGTPPAAPAGAPDATPAPGTTPPLDGDTPSSENPEGNPAGNPAGNPPETSKRKRKTLPTARPPGAPPDPWTAFATTTERAPGRIRRALRVVGRAFIGEYALVTYAALVLAVALTWPTMRYPLHTMPQEVGDPARQAWQIAWSGHILLTHPAQLWHANAYFPTQYSFAFGDSLLGYAPAGMLGTGPLAATLRYNILFVLAHALLLIGGYALVRQLGAGRTGATVAAVAFAFAPWRLAQEGHLDIVSAGGIPLALAMLARGHGWSMRHGIRPERRRPGWAALGWLVAAWQVSLGFTLGLPFVGVLGAIVLVMIIGVPIRRLRRRGQGAVLGWPLLIIDLIGVLFVAMMGALIAVLYFKIGSSGSNTKEISFYSPPWRSLLIGPAQSRIWGGAHAVPRASLGWPAEMTLLPGFVLYALALAGLLFSVWKWWHRLLLLLGLAAAVILTLGTTFYGGRWTYLPIFGHLPGQLGLWIPGRLMLWVTLLLAILAAGAVAEFVRRAEQMSAQRIPPWPGPWLRLATLVPLLLVIVESLNVTPHPVVATQPAAMRTITAPMVVLPTTAVGDQTVMLWSTSRFQPLANGGGTFAAARQAQLRASIAAFPDVASIQYLRGLGVTSVLLLRLQAIGTPWERAGDVPVDALGIQREDLDDTTVLFRLN